MAMGDKCITVLRKSLAKLNGQPCSTSWHLSIYLSLSVVCNGCNVVTGKSQGKTFYMNN